MCSIVRIVLIGRWENITGLNSSGPGDFLLSKVVSDCLTLSVDIMSLYKKCTSEFFICLK